MKLRADKHKRFLQVDSITLGVHIQHTQSTKTTSLEISQGRREGYSLFFTC